MLGLQCAQQEYNANFKQCRQKSSVVFVLIECTLLWFRFGVLKRVRISYTGSTSPSTHVRYKLMDSRVLPSRKMVVMIVDGRGFVPINKVGVMCTTNIFSWVEEPKAYPNTQSHVRRPTKCQEPM